MSLEVPQPIDGVGSVFPLLDPASQTPCFVITLQLDAASFAILQQWRTRHFPPERNHIPAHLTLFHKTSTEQVSRLSDAWREFEPLAPLRLRYTAPRLLGNGVAIEVESNELCALRARLVDSIAGNLTRQDQRPFRPHVTIQNKVDAAEARRLHQSLSGCFEPWCGEGTAVLAWEYRGGPWAHRAQFSFGATTRRSPARP